MAASSLFPLPEIFAKLDTALPAASVKVLRNVLKREREPARGVWISKAWGSLGFKDFQATSNPCVVVFAEPVVSKESLVLTPRHFGGLFGERDTAVFVFLGAVTCNDFCTAPGTLAIFDGGLTVERLACFDGGDAHTDVRGHLEAPYVISGLGGGRVELAKNTKAKVGAYARYIKGLPKGDTAKKHATVASLLSLPEEELEDQEAWEWTVSFIVGGRALPAAKASSTRTKTSPKAKVTSPKAREVTAKKVTARSKARKVAKPRSR